MALLLNFTGMLIFFGPHLHRSTKVCYLSCYNKVKQCVSLNNGILQRLLGSRMEHAVQQPINDLRHYFMPLQMNRPFPPLSQALLCTAC